MSREDRHRPEYRAFLLRLWRDSNEQGWRASLQNTTTGQRYHFGTLDDLFAFLDIHLGDDDGDPSLNPRSL